MPNDLPSLFGRNIGTDMERRTAENYKPQTTKAHRALLKRLVSLIEAAGISRQNLTAEGARRVPAGRHSRGTDKADDCASTCKSDTLMPQ